MITENGGLIRDSDKISDESVSTEKMYTRDCEFKQQTIRTLFEVKRTIPTISCS